MTAEEAQSELFRIVNDYKSLKEPKYRHADLNNLQRDYQLLMEMKGREKDNPIYSNIVNAISQTIRKMTPKEQSTWMNVTERGINKAIPPVIRRKNQPVEFPFQWVDDKSGETCFINNGYWGARNYMVMDVVGYCLLLKEGKDLLPENPAPIFTDLNSISLRESHSLQDADAPVTQTNDQTITSIKNTRYWIRFDDKEFRKHSGLEMDSGSIRDLLLETSRVEFKLVFPVRMMDGKQAKEKIYNMNCFSRLFEFGYIDREVRSDGVVQNREYYISFTTLLGELFSHNLLSHSYDWLDISFYKLPFNAQVFYRRFLVHNDCSPIQLKIETITERLNLQDKNITNLTGTIEKNILNPLLEQKLIDAYEVKENGLYGRKYIIKRTRNSKKKGKLSQSDGCTGEDVGSVKDGSGVCKERMQGL